MLYVANKYIDISCNVRNELNGLRNKSAVVLSIPDKKPVMPRQFPIGVWEIYKPVKRDSAYLAPYFIPTNAFQMLPIWELDNNGLYKRKTTNLTRDIGYGLHYSTSSTTLGCIKIQQKNDLLWIIEYIGECFNKDIFLEIEVI